jgi:hypothetical protein
VLRILSGNREEYVPAPLSAENGLPNGDNTYDISVPLKKLFSRSVVTIEPNIGHYIFDYADADGLNAVTRELLTLVGENPKEMRKIEERVQNENSLQDVSTVVAKKYAQDPLFRAWADQTYGAKTVLRAARNADDRLLKKISDEYTLAKTERELEIVRKIIATKTTNPDFYQKFQKQIDTMNPNKVDSSIFVPYMTMVLQGNIEP